MMSNKLPDNLSMPACVMIPVLEYVSITEAITWLTGVFGFTERWRIAAHRAQLAFDDCAVAITEARPGKPILSSSIIIRVKNVAHYYERAQQYEAEIIRPPSDFPYGERQFSVKDIGGHIWVFSQTIANVTPEDWGAISANL